MSGETDQTKVERNRRRRDNRNSKESEEEEKYTRNHFYIFQVTQGISFTQKVLILF